MFCRVVEEEMPEEIILEEEDFVAIRDIYPKVDGHMLIISKEHFVDFMDLPSEVGERLFGFVGRVVEKAGIKDFNLVANKGRVAGQVVPHFHFHILPRREGDGFKFGI